MRLEIAPSRMLAAALWAVGALAGVGLFLTDLPAALAALLGPVCILWGGWLARGVLTHPRMCLVLGRDGIVRLDDAALDDAGIDWQGPLMLLHGRFEGRPTRRVIWPDVLDSAARREVRLWTLAHRSDASRAPVAP